MRRWPDSLGRTPPSLLLLLCADPSSFLSDDPPYGGRRSLSTGVPISTHRGRGVSTGREWRESRSGRDETPHGTKHALQLPHGACDAAPCSCPHLLLGVREVADVDADEPREEQPELGREAPLLVVERRKVLKGLTARHTRVRHGVQSVVEGPGGAAAVERQVDGPGSCCRGRPPRSPSSSRPEPS